MGHRASLDIEARGKIFCRYRGSNPGCPVCSQTPYWMRYPTPKGSRGRANYQAVLFGTLFLFKGDSSDLFSVTHRYRSSASSDMKTTQNILSFDTVFQDIRVFHYVHKVKVSFHKKYRLIAERCSLSCLHHNPLAFSKWQNTSARNGSLPALLQVVQAHASLNTNHVLMIQQSECGTYFGDDELTVTVNGLMQYRPYLVKWYVMTPQFLKYLHAFYFAMSTVSKSLLLPLLSHIVFCLSVKSQGRQPCRK
jgi:hypothetical protein